MEVLLSTRNLLHTHGHQLPQCHDSSIQANSNREEDGSTLSFTQSYKSSSSQLLLWSFSSSSSKSNIHLQIWPNKEPSFQITWTSNISLQKHTYNKTNVSDIFLPLHCHRCYHFVEYQLIFSSQSNQFEQATTFNQNQSICSLIIPCYSHHLINCFICNLTLFFVATSSAGT